MKQWLIRRLRPPQPVALARHNLGVGYVQMKIGKISDRKMQFKKTKPLYEGDSVAAVSPSWGGPSEFPDVVDYGLKRLKRLGLDVFEFPMTRMSAAELRRNPPLPGGTPTTHATSGDSSFA